MDENIFRQLKECKIFSSLQDNVLQELSKQFEIVFLKQHKILFRQGDLSDSFYLLVSGKVFVFLTPEKKPRKFLAEILPGEMVGELGAISHEPRATTAKAAEDCVLLKLPSHVFIDIYLKYPDVGIAIINASFDRSYNLLKLITEEGRARRHIALLPAHSAEPLLLLQESLKKLLSNVSNIVLVSDESSFSSIDSIEDWIKSQEKNNTMIIYFLHAPDSILTKACFARADMIYVLADAASPVLLHENIRKILNEYQYKIKPELILLHQIYNDLPNNTKAWLKLYRFHLHHHIRFDRVEDWQRLLRFMRGKAVGVVLGGGGLRCWAQLGALKALHEAKIPIDMIGGTSAGSIVGGFYALHETFIDSRLDLRRLSEMTRATVSLKNMTWPAVSLFNGEDYTRCLQSIFGKVKMENLWLPTFFICCDLAANKQVIMRTGSLWRVIRSSTSVPAVFPPVVVRGQIYLDGGILNNLPVDVMQKMIGQASTMIAVELTHGGENNQQYYFPPVLPFWKTLLAKIGIAFKTYKFPRFVETFLKSLLAGSAAKQKENAALADILVAPDLSRFGLLSVTAEQENELFELGYQEAHRKIKKWRRKHPTYSFNIV